MRLAVTHLGASSLQQTDNSHVGHFSILRLPSEPQIWSRREASRAIELFGSSLLLLIPTPTYRMAMYTMSDNTCPLCKSRLISTVASVMLYQRCGYKCCQCGTL